MITLRPYQQTAINDTVKELQQSKRKRGIIEMPTGGGKTVVFSYIVKRAESKGSKCLILTDREELLKGTGGTLENFNIKPQYIRAGRKFPPKWPNGLTIVGMAQTLKNRLKSKRWNEWFQTIDFVIIDEVHKQDFNRFFERDIFEGKTVLGFSATPKRQGKQRQLGKDFDFIVHTKSVPELIDLGYLMPDLYYGFKDYTPDMKGVAKNSKGDYSETDMFKRYDSPKLYGGVVKAWAKNTYGTITLVFCTNIIHCVRTAKQFTDAGIPAKFLCSSMSKPTPPDFPEEVVKEDLSPEWVRYYEKLAYYKEYNEAMLTHSGSRTQILNAWKAGEFKVLINAGILTTGFDYPPIETIVLFRATISEILYLQMLGRGSRPSPETHKTHFNILDFGGNAKRLGGYKMPRRWHLYHEGKNGSGVPPVKECGDPGKDKNGKLGCGDFILASAKICPSCGYVYPEKEEPKEVDMDLIYIDEKGKMRNVKPLYQMSYGELEQFAELNKYKNFWIYIQIYSREGREGLKNYAKFKGYSPGWVTITESKLPESVKHEKTLNT